MIEDRYLRVKEPNYGLLSIEIPADWHLEGGAYPSSTVGAGIPSQPLKLDLKIVGNREDVWIRLLPSTLFIDPSMVMPYGYFPIGTAYNNMIVFPIMEPFYFIVEVVIPYLFNYMPCEKNMIAMNYNSEISSSYCSRFPQGLAMGNIYSGGDATWEINKNGSKIIQHSACVIERMLSIPGVWSNVYNYAVSAPSDLFQTNIPIFKRILGSIEFNNEVISESASQRLKSADPIHSQTAYQFPSNPNMRSLDPEQMKKIQEINEYASKIDKEIADNRRKTQEEIMKGISDTFYR